MTNKFTVSIFQNVYIIRGPTVELSSENGKGEKKMKKTLAVLACLFLCFLVGINLQVLAIRSVSAAPKGWSAHTFFHIRQGARPMAVAGLSPSQIRTAYNLPSTGGTGTIAIVDAFDDPTALNDLNVFSSQFGLPTANFEKHTMSNGIPTDGGWALEMSLDVQWAHAVAPTAKILLVEATSNGDTDLLAAVDYARSRSDVVAISMSWGGPEFSGSPSYDSYFTSAYGATFFASSGDNGAGVSWPAVSANVVGVGGTTLTFSGGVVSSETAWSGSGGGISSYVTEPSYQLAYGVSGTNGHRGVPDVSYDADPNSGVAVYDSTPYNFQTGWWVVGGTSAGSPQWAAIQSLGLTSTNNNFYTDAKSSSYSSYFRDITSGSNGYPAKIGYDLVTGVGSPLTTNFTPVTTPDFSISASPSALTINAGTGGTSAITVQSLNTFSGTVALTVTGPTGWTLSVNPTSLTIGPGGSGTSTLSITVPTGTTAGTYTVTAKGTSGSLNHPATVAVTVPAPVTPDFSISASPSSLTIRRGATGTSTVTIKSLNTFSGTVALTVTGPNGWTLSVNPTSLTVGSGGSATSTLTIKVPTTASRGTYTVTIRGTSGSLTHTTTVTVTVPRR
jgi:subtilase family serine protease